MATQASDSIRQRPRATAADELAVVVQRAQAFTNASGAAIAVSEGNTDEIVCRARSGSSAPDVGTALRVQGSFTGICIQTGKELRCDDAETDTRMDSGAIRALGIRSMVVTPIREEGKVVGVLAVFAPTPHAFTITHVAVLKTMADQISALLQKERRTVKDEPAVEAPVIVPKPVAAPKPPVAVPLPPPVVIKPVSTPSGAAAAPARSNGSSVPRIDSRPVALAAEIAPPVPFPKKEEKREHRPEPSPTVKTSFGTLDAVAGNPEKSSAKKFIFVGVIAAVVVAAGLGWFFLKSHKSSPSAPAQAAQQPQNPTPAATSPGASANPVVAPGAPVLATPVAAAPSNPKPEVSQKPDSKKGEAKKKDQQNSPPAPATVAFSGGPSKIAQSAPAEQPQDVSPSLAVGGNASPGLASLARPVTSSTPAMIAQSDLVNAKAIRAVPAIYPELAKARRISGAVVVKVTVGKDGKVSNPRFLSGPIIFRDAAFDAVKQWQFKPAELNGQAIEQETEIRVNFHPSQ
jgi:TonB family protein